MSAASIVRYRRDGDIPFLGSHDPNDTDLYAITLQDELYSGESISSVAWDATGLTVDDTLSPSTFTDQDGNVVTDVRVIVLSGGTAGQTYTVRARFSLSGGPASRQIDVSFRILCKEH